MKLLARMILVLLTLESIGAAQAADLCKALAIRDVPAIESATSIIKRGSYDEAITQFRVSKTNGDTSFCSHGGYCYPTHVPQGGDKMEALRLTNCKVGARIDDDANMVIYGVDVVRAAVPSTELTIDDLDNQLRAMGLCSACADNVADVYFKKPESACAKTTRKALEGNPDALNNLVAMESAGDCKASWNK
jgi:hypothetical protein